MKKFKERKEEYKKQLSLLNEEIRALKVKKSDLQAKINERKSSLESLSEQYKWYELKDKLSDKKDLKANIKNVESELSDICSNLSKAIKKKNLLIGKRGAKILLAFACISLVAAFAVGIATTVFSDISLPEKSSGYINAVDNTFSDDILQTDESTEEAFTEPTTEATTAAPSTTKPTEVSTTAVKTTKQSASTSKAHSSNTKTTNKSSSTHQTTAKHNYSSGSNSSGTVYITDTGTKYHREGCRFLKSKYAISRSDAIKNGYEPCGVCNPY